MEKIGKYITYDDVVKSDTAKRLGVINAPDDEQLSNIIILITNVYDKVVDHFNKKIGFNSCFRCPELNKAIGGVPTSQHCTGEAIDIDADIYGNVTNVDIFTFIRSSLEFDQLIAESLDSHGNIAWVHASYSKIKNRKQVLVSVKVNGKQKYFPYDSAKGFVSTNYVK